MLGNYGIRQFPGAEILSALRSIVMRSQYSVSTAISAAVIVVFVITLTSAQAGSNSSQSSTLVTPASSETVNNAENNWNPFRAAKRAAGAAVSGARKVTKGIAGTIGGLFGGEDESASKDGKGEVMSTATAVSPAQQTPVVKDGLADDNTVEASELASPAQAPFESQVNASAVKNETALKADGVSAHTSGNPATTKVAAKVEEITSHPKCEKAKKTIGTYAFTNIEAKSCEGKVYFFSASRDGSQFSVKVSANGELLEVEKLEPGSLAKNDGKAQQKFPSVD
jgi:hypothetical protein